ncbi:MAG: T9SS type A sorting domain-containing protein [Bacteroidia bacterium]
MKRRLIKSTLLIGALVILSTVSARAQALQRQSIGFIGGSTDFTQGLFVQSIVGQPYSLTPSSFDSYYVNPGFEQSALVQTAPLELEINTLIYPNPANATLNIEVDVADVRMSIMDLHGRSVYHAELAENQIHNVDCKNWSAGTYFVLFFKNDHQIQASKLVIAHQ